MNRARKLSLTMNINIDGALVELKKQRKDRKRKERTVRQKKHSDSVTYRRLNKKSGGGKQKSEAIVSSQTTKK